MMNRDLFDIVKHGFLPVCDLPNKQVFDHTQSKCLEPWADEYGFDITGWDADFEFELCNVDDVFVISWHLHQPDSSWYGDESLAATTELYFLCQISAVGYNDLKYSECYPIQSWQQLQEIHQQHWHRFVKQSTASFDSMLDGYFENQSNNAPYMKHLYTPHNYNLLHAHWRRYKSAFVRRIRAMHPVHYEHPLQDQYT